MDWFNICREAGTKSPLVCEQLLKQAIIQNSGGVFNVPFFFCKNAEKEKFLCTRAHAHEMQL